jgi:glycosyltransferase involved in cell wall biosynthesis
MPRLLVISPHFPPVNAPDMQRVRMSLPHFVDAGWEVVVLTVADPEPMAPVEPPLLTTVPRPVEVVRVPVLPLRWTGPLGLRNLGWRALPFIFLEGSRLLAEQRFDLVYFSTTQFIVCPLGRIWRRLHGTPYVIDLQDPWLNDFYARTGLPPPGGWKHGFATLNARLLEGWTLRKCAHLISVSAVYLDELAARYRWFRRDDATVLTFGAPDADFRAAAAQPAHDLLPASSALRIAYAGRLGPDMLPALDLLFAAVARAGAAGRRIELHFFGSSYARAGTGERTTTALAEKHGVADRVSEKPDRIGYLDSLRLLRDTDVALLLGSSDRAYSPSKVYPTLLADRPTLALAPEGSVLEERVCELGGAALAPFPVASPLDGLETATEILVAAADGRALPGARPLDRERLERDYTAAAVAARQLRVFNRVLRAGTSSRVSAEVEDLWSEVREDD